LIGCFDGLQYAVQTAITAPGLYRSLVSKESAMGNVQGVFWNFPKPFQARFSGIDPASRVNTNLPKGTKVSH
jgi:hypothetical protein